MKAKDILSKGESAIMIFTDGRNLTINKDGTGVSGNWVVRKSASPDRVIVYFRNKSTNKNEIYTGDFVQLLPSTEKELKNRLAVGFVKMKYAGNTDSKWNEFTYSKHGSVNPIRYIN